MTTEGPAEPGRVMALDYGTVRIGVAVSDALRITAGPLSVLDAATALEDIQALVQEYRPSVIVVGLPVSRSGEEGQAAERARAFAGRVAESTGVPIELVDERFTTHTAEQALLEAGVRRRDRRRNVDKVAAAVILRHYLDRRESSRDRPGSDPTS